MQKNKFNTICDSAWGSSAKGAASTRLVEIHNVKNISSSNYPNAGHTAIYRGHKFVSKSLPTAAILNITKRGKEDDGFVHHHEQKYKKQSWIGPNSGFSLEQFKKEMAETKYEFGDESLKIHERAILVEQRHVDAESPTGSQSTEHISSTMSGSGAAATEKAMRKGSVLIGSLPEFQKNTLAPFEFIKQVRKELMRDTFLHEVSQGYALSLNRGTHYPSCTSRDCTPQQAYADFGILPSMGGDVYLNVRSFPIRVGNNYRDGKQTGYSGDFLDDQVETSWEEIGKKAEMPQSEIDLLAEKERTTVTKKIRRVATFSWRLLKESAEFCGATKLILNFPQYLHWSCYQAKGGCYEMKQLHPLVRSFVDKMEDTTNLPVVMIGTGANHEDYIYCE